MTDTIETPATAAKSPTKHPRKMAREPKAEAAANVAAAAPPSQAKRQNKTDLVLNLLKRQKARPSTSWSR